MGIGANFVPDVLSRDLIDEIVTVKEDDSYRTGRELSAHEGVLAGITSGAAVWAASRGGASGIRGQEHRRHPARHRRAVFVHKDVRYQRVNFLPSRKKLLSGRQFLVPNRWKPPTSTLFFPSALQDFPPFPANSILYYPHHQERQVMSMISRYIFGTPSPPWRSSAKLRRRAAKFPTSPSPKRTAASLSLPSWATMTSSSGWARMSAASTSAGIFYRAWNMDDFSHTENKGGIYASHNLLLFSGEQGVFGAYFDDPGAVTFDLGYSDGGKAVITSEKRQFVGVSN